uniref:Hexosyltransferase n=1 Tax=Acrobeloides nanus TaxID=290746 RepID=A0A914DZZ7_9BILA
MLSFLGSWLLKSDHIDAGRGCMRRWLCWFEFLTFSHNIALKLILYQFLWILPYLMFANYLERSLLPFRLLCYTDSDYLSVRRPLRRNTHECIQQFFPNRNADPGCRLDQPLRTLIEPTLSSTSTSIVVIRSAPASIDYRNYIRSTWKKSLEPEIPVIFVTGLGNFDLVPESSQYDDILQLDFVDSYMNLTHKMIATYKYVLRKRSIKHIIVINDDTIVNGTALKRQLLTAQFHPEKRYVIGKVSRGYPRLFFPWLLWYVPGEMYPHKCYPPFVQGSSFIISREAASEISQRICDFPFVHLDDIMMGVVTNCLGIRNVHKEGFDKHFPRICDFPFVHLDDIMMGVVTNCLGIRNVHKEGFDKHVPESFTVFHYQYSRYSVEKLQNLWTDLKRNKEL